MLRPLGWRMGAANGLVWLFGVDASEQSEPERDLEPLHLARGRGFTFEIVGEANYQPALDAICGGKCEDWHRLPKLAQLCFVEKNPHDRNAVVVLIDGKVVGYIPRNLAEETREAILQLNPEERPISMTTKGGSSATRDNRYFSAFYQRTVLSRSDNSLYPFINGRAHITVEIDRAGEGLPAAMASA